MLGRGEAGVGVPIFNGCTFGLSSAVLIFNRLTTLATATSRRTFGVLVDVYFDDNAVIESMEFSGCGQRCHRATYEAFGAPLSEKKNIAVDTAVLLGEPRLPRRAVVGRNDADGCDRRL